MVGSIPGWRLLNHPSTSTDTARKIGQLWWMGDGVWWSKLYQYHGHGAGQWRRLMSSKCGPDLDIGPGPESITASATLAECRPGRTHGTDGGKRRPERHLDLGPVPADDGGTAIVRYEVRYRETGGSYGSWRTVPGGASARSATVRNLDNGTSYEFQVRAVNGISPGHAATASATLAESAPGAPSGLTATGGDESVTLNWSAPGDGGSQILRYEYRYAASGETWGEWMTVSGGGSARRVAVSGLTNGTLYGFQVRAVNSVDAGEAAEATATPGRAPTAPTGLAASVESESITVMWGMPADDGGSAIVRYEVNYRDIWWPGERLDDSGRRRECHQPHHHGPDQRDRL